MTQEKENRIREGEEILSQVDFGIDREFWNDVGTGAIYVVAVVCFCYYIFF